MFSNSIKSTIAKIFILLVVTPIFFSAVDTHAQAANPPTTAQDEKSIPDSLNLDCGIGTIAACIVLYTTWALFIKLPGWLLTFASKISNTIFAYGLSSDTFNQPGFINPGWVICRDVVNTFFIFALLYLAIMTIIGKLGGAMKSQLVTLIIVAIFMNFSMYITRFVIDVGNVVALEFYNAFPDPPQGSYVITIPGIAQRDIFGGFYGTITHDIINMTSSWSNVQLSEQWPWYVFLFFCLGIIQLVFIFVILAASFFMVARVATLWILMIVSPIAFFAYGIPKFSATWSTWTGELTKQVFFPAILLFFIYLAILLSDATVKTFMTTAGNFENVDNSEIFSKLITTALHFACVAAFLLYGLSKAKSGASHAAVYASKYLGGATSFGLGAGLGVAAAGMRKGAGSYAEWKNRSLSDEDKAKMTTTRFGRMQLAALDKAQTASFDIRNTKTFGNTIGVAAGLGGINFGQGGGQGGYAKGLGERLAENTKYYKNLKTDEQKAAFIQNLSGTGILGAGPTTLINRDDAPRQFFNSLPVAERQKLIANSKGDTQAFLQRIGKSLGDKYSTDQLLELYKADEHNPIKQSAVIKDFLNGKQDASGNIISAPRTEKEMTDMLKKLSVTERAEMETSLKESPVELDKIKTLNRQILEKLKAEKPKQYEAALKETATYEREQKFKVYKDTIDESIAKYQTASDADKQNLQNKINDALNNIDRNKITELSGAVLSHELVAKNLKREDLDKITKSNTISMSRGEQDAMKTNALKGKDQGVMDFYNYAPAANKNKRAKKK